MDINHSYWAFCDVGWCCIIDVCFAGDDLFDEAKKKPTQQEVGWFCFLTRLIYLPEMVSFLIHRLGMS